MTATESLNAEVLTILEIARRQADEAGIADREAFARRMVDAAMRGKVDRWILESRDR